VEGGRCRWGSSASNSTVAAATLRIALSKVGSVRLEGVCNPLTFRTYCRAAASISSAVASGCRPRRVVIFRHMEAMLRVGQWPERGCLPPGWRPGAVALTRFSLAPGCRARNGRPAKPRVRRCRMGPYEMVGETGLEPATPSPPELPDLSVHARRGPC
jgi:hypothetical protein